jgi:hypothetical protein
MIDEKTRSQKSCETVPSWVSKENYTVYIIILCCLKSMEMWLWEKYFVVLESLPVSVACGGDGREVLLTPGRDN